MTFRKDTRLDSSQVEDYRGRRVGTRGLAVGGGGAAGLIVLVLVMLLGGGGDLGTLVDQVVGAGGSAEPASTTLLQECKTGADANARDDCRIVGYVDSIQAWWTKAFTDGGETYRPSKTRFFSGIIDTGCGTASSEVGPFYCPADKYVYIDLGFFDELKAKFGATGGPMAQAYILAHEYGHHVQDLLGLLEGGSGETGATSQAVRTELQADCLAGVWAHHSKLLESGDVEEGLRAASAIGDDRIQRRAQGYTVPESWTHGSSEQRVRWLRQGLESGDINSCDVFAARDL
jgi:hypothetical protein